MENITIIEFNRSEWAIQAASLIDEKVRNFLNHKGVCSVMLTGGNNAANLYKAWSRLPSFNKLSGVSFYFGDERCVNPTHIESNYNLVMRTLFDLGLPLGCKIFRIKSERTSRDEEAIRYDSLIPKVIDVLLLGVGDDGHIASIFPFSNILHELERGVVYFKRPNGLIDRFTITPKVIKNSQFCFLLAGSEAKIRVLAKAKSNPANIESMPVRLLSNGIWLTSCS